MAAVAAAASRHRQHGASWASSVRLASHPDVPLLEIRMRLRVSPNCMLRGRYQRRLTSRAPLLQVVVTSPAFGGAISERRTQARNVTRPPSQCSRSALPCVSCNWQSIAAALRGVLSDGRRTERGGCGPSASSGGRRGRLQDSCAYFWYSSGAWPCCVRGAVRTGAAIRRLHFSFVPTHCRPLVLPPSRCTSMWPPTAFSVSLHGPNRRHRRRACLP